MRACLVWPLLLVACGEPEPEMPEGWEDATLLVDFTQSDCAGDPGSAQEEILVQVTLPTVRVNWDKTLFRCDQAVEAYLRQGDGNVDLLVQPVDLNPEQVARCDCLYDLEARFNGDETLGSVTLYKRNDEVGGPSTPVQITSVVLN